MFISLKEVLWCIRKCHSIAKNEGLGPNSKFSNSTPFFEVVAHLKVYSSKAASETIFM